MPDSNIITSRDCTKANISQLKKNLNSLQLPHLHVNLTGALLVPSLQILKCFLAFLGGFLVVLQRHGELIPQIFHDRLQVNAKSVLVFQVLTVDIIT